MVLSVLMTVQSPGELVIPYLVVRARLTATLWSSMRTITMVRMPIARRQHFWTPWGQIRHGRINSLSEFGGVTRGLRMTVERGYLTSIKETKNIMKSAEGPYVEETDDMKSLNGNIPVSMNMWAFTPDVLVIGKSGL